MEPLGFLFEMFPEPARQTGGNIRVKKQFLETGKIVTTHGVRGEVKVEPWCDSPQEFLQLRRLYLEKGAKEVTPESIRVQKNMVLLKLKGVDDMDAAVALRGKILYLNREDVSLEEGDYFVQDLLDMRVIDADDGREYGILTEVSQTGANDVYHIRFADGKIRLIPAIRDVVIETDIESGVMRIRPLAGLFDDEN